MPDDHDGSGIKIKRIILTVIRQNTNQEGRHRERERENKSSCITKKYKYAPAAATETISKLNFVALVRERTMPTDRPPLLSEVSASFRG
jgi:hypothetical protein